MKLRTCILFLAPTVVSAAVFIESTIPELFEKSDLVCRGTILSETQLNANGLDARGKLLPIDYLALIDARSCYKGRVPGTTLRLSLPSVDPMRGAPLSMGPQLLFVKMQAEGTYVLTDVRASFPFWELPPGTRDSERGIAQIEDDLMQIVTATDPKTSRRAMELLLRFPSLSTKSLQMLGAVRIDSDPDLAVLRLVLLARTDTSGNLAELVKALKYRDPRPSSRGSSKSVKYWRTIQPKATSNC
jgi:hypothetical protein